MGVKVTYDGANRLIIAKAGITTLDVKVDLYSDAKEDWLTDNALLGHPFPWRTVGGDPITGTLDTGDSYFLQNQAGSDWRFRPDEVDHELTITGNFFREDTGLPIIVPTVGGFTVLVQNVVSSLTQTVKTTRKFEKNVAIPLYSFFMFDSGDHLSPALSKTVTGRTKKSGGVWTLLNNPISEVGGAGQGRGWYVVTIDSDEMNADQVDLEFTATGADTARITLHTETNS